MKDSAERKTQRESVLNALGGRRGTITGESKAPRRSPSKYRAIRTVYAGVSYQSKAEAARAAELDLLLKAGEIVDWIGQPKVRLGVPENVYVPDFLVLTWVPQALRADGGQGMIYPHYEDVKGVETPKFRRDKSLWKAYGRLPLRIIKGGRVVEIITPDGRD